MSVDRSENRLSFEALLELDRAHVWHPYGPMPGRVAPLLVTGAEGVRLDVRLPSGEHEKISFDCQNHRSLRIQELRTAANVAAEKVRKTGTPYQFSPMSSRERRIVHLALRDEADLRTESEGEGMRRCLVVYPKDYKAAGHPAPRTIP